MTAEDDLMEKWNRKGITLYSHQAEGIVQMNKWIDEGRGGINADEMGLGKTCQAIIVLSTQFDMGKGPFLVISPLSVCEHWKTEIIRFSCGKLKPAAIFGAVENRTNALEEMGQLKRNHVVIMPPHTFRDTFEDFYLQMMHDDEKKFDIVVVDEAQNIKNNKANITMKLAEMKQDSLFLLLTGTPIQNNLNELYSLLSFADHKEFMDDEEAEKEFVKTYKKPKELVKLHEILKKYMIRRTKDKVITDLPTCEQVVLYHDITTLQKKLYLDLIQKDYKSLSSHYGSSDGITVSLNALHIQLRKCVAHPYLFPGIEPEPFKEGEHLVEASGKLQVLDGLLKYIKKKKHKCLIFSQFTMILDILQDFMDLRGWKYERIDGSVRADDRFESINRFQQKNGGDPGSKEDAWCFMLTTKTGGVGLTLTQADTVIFMDSDYNPQNDIQAMARCHRIGQDKPVRVIRLVGRYTVEQQMQAFARKKTKFNAALLQEAEDDASGILLADMAKCGLGQLNEHEYEAPVLLDKNLEKIIGGTDSNGRWMPSPNDTQEDEEILKVVITEDVDEKDIDPETYRFYKGVRYDVSKEDEDVLDKLIAKKQSTKDKGSSKRRRFDFGDDDENIEPEEETEEERKKRMDRAAARKARLQEKKEQMWKENGYKSYSLPLPVQEPDEIEQDMIPITYTYGDVTKPRWKRNDDTTNDLILHCVDNGGSFGSGGIFTLLRDKDSRIAAIYEKAYDMKDLSMSDVHLIDNFGSGKVFDEDSPGPSTSTQTYSRPQSVALFVAMSHTNRGKILPNVLETCLSRIGEYASRSNCCVHMSRLGYGTNLSWYMVERMIRKHLSYRGVPVYIYYFKRTNRPTTTVTATDATKSEPKPATPKKRENLERRKATTKQKEKDLEDFIVDDEEMEESEEDDDDDDEYKEDAHETDISEGSEQEDVDAEEELSPIKEKDRSTKPKKRTAIIRKTEDEKTDNKEKEKEEEYDNDYDVSGELEREGMSDPVDGRLASIVLSVYGLKDKDAEQYRDAIISLGGYIIEDEYDLENATHALVPQSVRSNPSSLQSFRQRFSSSCILVENSWVEQCTLTGAYIPVEDFVI